MDLRICSHCNSGAVGDEMHFLLFCDKFHCERQAMLEVINEECANFSRLLDWDKFIWLMNNENPRILSSLLYKEFSFLSQKVVILSKGLDFMIFHDVWGIKS